MPREKLKREAPTRARVPMRGTGTEQSVVGMKVLQWNWTEGTAVSCRGRRPTGDGRSRVTKAKPFDIPKREVWEAFKKVKANRERLEWMDSRLRSSRRLLRATSTGSGTGCPRGATSLHRCGGWTSPKPAAARVRWASRR